MVASTEDRDWRQLAVLDAAGGSAHFHGARVKPAMGCATGADCIAIGNILANDAVPAAMVAAFVGSAGLAFPERLLVALEAGEAAGGEGRPLVSAALLVVKAASFPYVDLRVDAAGNPLHDLRALWLTYSPFAELYAARALAPLTVPAT